jgi:hypothetical protein
MTRSGDKLYALPDEPRPPSDWRRIVITLLYIVAIGLFVASMPGFGE